MSDKDVSNKPMGIDIYPDTISFAFQEYTSTRAEIQEIISKVAQGFGFVAAILALFSGDFIIRFTASESDKFNSVISSMSTLQAWVLPFVLHFSFLTLSWLIFQFITLEYNAVKLVEFIQNNFPAAKNIPFKFEAEGIFMRMLSIGSGYKPFKMMLMLVSFLVIVIALSVNIICFLIIRNNDILGSSIFLVFDAIISFFVLSMFYFSVFGLLEKFKKADDLHKYLHMNEIKISYRRIVKINRKKFFYKLIPRPVDLFNKGFMFVWGFIYALIYDNNTIEKRGGIIEWVTGKNYINENFIHIILIFIIFFFIEEFLIQQAKLLWNDIRDINDDPYLSKMNHMRALVSKNISKKEAIIQCIVRWNLGLGLAYFLDIQIFFLCLVITILQIFYEFYIKKIRNKKYSIIFMFYIATGWILRFIIGALALGATFESTFSKMYLISVYFIFMGVYCLYIYTEAIDREMNQKKKDRVQSSFYKKHGIYIARIVFISAIYNFILYFTLHNLVDNYIIIAFCSIIINILFYKLHHLIIDKLMYKNDTLNNKVKDSLVMVSVVILLMLLFNNHIQILNIPLMVIFFLFYEGISYNELSYINLLNNYKKMMYIIKEVFTNKEFALNVHHICILLISLNKDWNKDEYIHSLILLLPNQQ